MDEAKQSTRRIGLRNMETLAKMKGHGKGIVIHLDDVLRKRRMTLTELSIQTGVTMANLSVLKTGKSRAMRFSTLAMVCDALNCQPGDIIRYRRTDSD